MKLNTWMICGALFALQGCSVVSATAGTAISVTGSVVSTAISVTGSAASAAIDAVAGNSSSGSCREQLAWTNQQWGLWLFSF